ncbi:GSCOCG00013620001-RA-CDS [Cotesia congregata]|uniref:Uncharacterized protein n=1 Tax=Cotesia congregata TaxID=51543 RepID=A0A8J2E5V3_COTCN|nr:GSCOCG00013620001-RA-CDS [Cotesia congregata]CAG5074262.1 Protein of unknown function [Cotesia congregata]
MKILVIALGLLLVASILEADRYKSKHLFRQALWVEDYCERQRDCENIRNSECSRGKCKCLPNYQRSGPLRKSICRGIISAFCESDNDCLNSDEVSCIFNTCQNFTKFLDSDAEVKKLYRATALRSRCETNEHCSNLKSSICVNGKCDCYDGYGINHIGNCDPLDKRYCGELKECWTDKVTCFGDYCMLPEEFFVESNAKNISAYKAYRIGDPCQTDHHCRDLSDTHCQNGKCICVDDHYEISGRCSYYPTYKIERNYADNFLAVERSLKNCASDSDCGNKPNLHCFHGKCVCSKGFQLQDNECQEMTNSTCTRHYQCPHGIKCYLNTCRYYNEFFSSDDADKYAAEGWNSACWTDHHCRDLNNTVCFENSCKCKLGYVWDFSADKCRKWPVIKCIDDENCISNNNGEQCVFGVCKLKLELYLTPTSIDLDLYVAKNYYNFCVNDHHCRDLNNTRCHNGACECFPGHEIVSDTCQKIIGKNCTTEEECLLPGSYCFFGTCMMYQDFLALPSNITSTHAATSWYGFCQTKHHCRNLEDAICKKSECVHLER